MGSHLELLRPKARGMEGRGGAGGRAHMVKRQPTWNGMALIAQTASRLTSRAGRGFGDDAFSRWLIGCSKRGSGGSSELLSALQLSASARRGGTSEISPWLRPQKTQVSPPRSPPYPTSADVP